GALAEAGLWRDLDEADQAAVIDELRVGEDSTWAAGGAWSADGEELADGAVEPWLKAMTAPLARCGVALEVQTITGPYDEDSEGYVVSVNGATLALYDFEPDEPGLPTSEDPWTDCTLEPAAEVNRLLAEADSDRRLAVFWPGSNDGFAVLGPEQALAQVAGSSDDWSCVIP
uniref:hypothetical protein n=1 Tax=Nocardioides sp. TaxID=35761 RepID=UPI003564660B